MYRHPCAAGYLSGGIEGGGFFNIEGPVGPSPRGIGVHIRRGSNNDVLALPGTLDGWDIGMKSTVTTISRGISPSPTRARRRADQASEVQLGGQLRRELEPQPGRLDHGRIDQPGAWSPHQNNGNIGVLVGYSAAGIVGKRCNPVSGYNKISDSATVEDSDIGIAIDMGNQNNVINGIGARSNGIVDLFDANRDCGENVWFFNFFGVANQPCIQSAADSRALPQSRPENMVRLWRQTWT
jgi:hypothetical protein